MNEDMVIRIQKCTEGGRCSHLYHETSGMESETIIYRVHLAAVLGKDDFFINDSIGRRNRND